MHETCPPANDHYVYLHRKASNGLIFYVGAGRKGRSKARCGRSKYWRSVVAKHGLEIEILADGLSFSESRGLEILTIRHLLEAGSKLCNMTAGGEGLNGLKHQDETKVKISLSNIGKNTGKKWSEDTRLKIMASRSGFRHSEETKLKIAAAQKGMPKNKPPHNKGKPMSKAQREALRGLPKSQACIKAIREKALARWAAIPKELRPKVDNSGANNPRADMLEYLFLHSSGEAFRGTRLEFRERYGANPKPLFGMRYSLITRGWRRYCS